MVILVKSRPNALNFSPHENRALSSGRWWNALDSPTCFDLAIASTSYSILVEILQLHMRESVLFSEKSSNCAKHTQQLSTTLQTKETLSPLLGNFDLHRIDTLDTLDNTRNHTQQYTRGRTSSTLYSKAVSSTVDWKVESVGSRPYCLIPIQKFELNWSMLTKAVTVWMELKYVNQGCHCLNGIEVC